MPEVSDDSSQRVSLADELGNKLSGDVRFDALSRTIFSTDASIYEITPIGVVMPKTVDDVVATVNACRTRGVPIVARGAGTGLAGGAVGAGLQLDLSRHLTRIGRLDVDDRTIEVEPGVVLDELNAHLVGDGLMFAPDLATSSRATIGGMIANNSCGAHSIIYGRTVDHVAAVDVILSNGERVTFADTESPDDTVSKEGQRIQGDLRRIRDEYYHEIQKRFPRVLRSNGGYGLDRLGSPDTPARAIQILCGSEGTLGIVVAAKLKLVPIPRHRVLLVLHFAELSAALAATPEIIRHNPSAVELVDHLIIEAALSNLAIRDRCGFLTGSPNALLIVEFHGESDRALAEKANALTEETQRFPGCTDVVQVDDVARQDDVWNLRTAGLGLLMSRPGDAQPYAFVEDSAVDPSRLREYIDRFGAILKEEGVQAGYYAHASVGCIHVRPILNLKRAEDVDRMARIAEAVSDLALEFGGAMTGEHGDGLVRSCWIEKMYGPTIVEAFREVKNLFDPTNLLNPNKIVDPIPMTRHLRYGATFEARSPKTHLDFSAHGGMAGMAAMCSGVGQCRQRLVGTMCPSYIATGDELHTTRARANALRVALSNRGLIDGLDDPQLAEVMDLCIGCKACKTECPTGVDMARLKVEYLARRVLIHGASDRARFIADAPRQLAMASHFPRISNAVTRSKLMRAWLERRYGLDRRLLPPRLAHRTFRSWFRRHRRARGSVPSPRGPVVYFVDTWTNYCLPQVGIAAVTLLEHAGFDVLCPKTFCCGRTAISQGLLTEAGQLAECNVRVLARFAADGVTIVGTEPSCLLTLVDEYPQLVRSPAADRIARKSVMIETLLRQLMDEDPGLFNHVATDAPLLYHAHCHQKALVGSADAEKLIRGVWGAGVGGSEGVGGSDRATTIDAGCCGMAGAFGHELEHYEIAKAIGEHRLFPAVRARGDAQIACSGFSCRTQIAHHTDATPRHLVEYLADGLGR